MTREQAINYLFSCGFTNEQVCEVVRALTYEPTTKNDLGVQMTNGEKMISAFPNGEVRKCEKGVVFSTGGWCHAYADEWWNAEYKEPTTKNNLPHCKHADEEIAKSFIEDVEAVKDQLPCFCEQMDFPNTFDEFADRYGFKDAEEIYTNGSELIPVFRVKQWLEHISTTKNNLGVEEVTALAEWTEKLTKASEDAYNKGYADGMKAQAEPKTGLWILDETDNSITCDRCGCLIWANDISNGEAYYCPNCGAKMETRIEEVEE